MKKLISNLLTSSNRVIRSAPPVSKLSVRPQSHSALVLTCLLVPLLSSHAAPAGWEVVASGLNNPRGLDFAPNGSLYVAEAGTGGNGPAVQGPEGPVQFGLSGAVTRVWQGKQERVVTDLPSLAAANGTAAIGPSAISFGQTGHALLTIGLGQDPAVRATLGDAAKLMGTLQKLNPNGALQTVADLAAYEAVANPDGNESNTNPNGVLNVAGAAYVTDAGANDLVRIGANGAISTVAVFPNRIVPTPPFLPQPPFPAQLPMEAVPTNVVRGPDDALYVSQLTGFPFPSGGARIYRVVPGAAPQIYAEGFTNVIDLAFDAAGNLYVLEIDQNGLLAPEVKGRLARINAADHSIDTIAAEGLVMPGGLAIGDDGAIYVSNFSTSPEIGEVIRLWPDGGGSKKTKRSN